MARKLTKKFGVVHDLSNATSVEIIVRPGAKWFSVVALFPSGRDLTLFTPKLWEEAFHLQQRLTVELLQRGKDMKVDEETGRLVVDND